jgi:hypothetical protein
MNKRGQYYLIAAIIIASILAGIISVKNYAIINPKPDSIRDLSSELKEECPRIIENSISNSKDPIPALEKFIEEEYSEYFLKKTENTNIIFIYGDKSSDFNAIRYNVEDISKPEITEVINWIPNGDYVEKGTITGSSSEDYIKVKLLDLDGNINKELEFNVKEDKIFYFYYLIFQEKNGELYIERN